MQYGLIFFRTKSFEKNEFFKISYFENRVSVKNLSILDFHWMDPRSTKKLRGVTNNFYFKNNQ